MTSGDRHFDLVLFQQKLLVPSKEMDTFSLLSCLASFFLTLLNHSLMTTLAFLHHKLWPMLKKATTCLNYSPHVLMWLMLTVNMTYSERAQCNPPPLSFSFLTLAVHSEPNEHVHLHFMIFISVCGCLLQQDDQICLREGCRRRE